MRDAEALLFIDHDQSQIAKAYVPGKHAVRADHHVDLARFNSLHYVLLFFGGTKARKQLNLDGKRREALAESIEVLISQHRRWRQDGGLLAVHHGFESRAHGYL